MIKGLDSVVDHQSHMDRNRVNFYWAYKLFFIVSSTESKVCSSYVNDDWWLIYIYVSKSSAELSISSLCISCFVSFLDKFFVSYIAENGKVNMIVEFNSKNFSISTCIWYVDSIQNDVLKKHYVSETLLMIGKWKNMTQLSSHSFFFFPFQTQGYSRWSSWYTWKAKNRHWLLRQMGCQPWPQSKTSIDATHSLNRLRLNVWVLGQTFVRVPKSFNHRLCFARTSR